MKICFNSDRSCSACINVAGHINIMLGTVRHLEMDSKQLLFVPNDSAIRQFSPLKCA